MFKKIKLRHVPEAIFSNRHFPAKHGVSKIMGKSATPPSLIIFAH